jgi:transcription elongation factor GreB
VSKAFTSEETPDLPPLVRPPPRLAPGEVRLVTPEGLAALRGELARLRTARADAAALPESERAARLADLDARAARVEGTLAVLTVRGPGEETPGRAGFATWVTVEDPAGTRATWRIVGPDESDPARGRIAVDSPVARALLGRAAGDVVEVRRPAGTVAWTVVDVRREPP